MYLHRVRIPGCQECLAQGQGGPEVRPGRQGPGGGVVEEEGCRGMEEDEDGRVSKLGSSRRVPPTVRISWEG